MKLPSGAAFVIANSCVEMNKAATSHYNIRVMECRLATKVLYGFCQTLMKPSSKYVLSSTPDQSGLCFNTLLGAALTDILISPKLGSFISMQVKTHAEFSESVKHLGSGPPVG